MDAGGKNERADHDASDAPLRRRRCRLAEQPGWRIRIGCASYV